MSTQRKLHNVMVTGGAGFIGCNFIHYLFDMSAADTAAKAATGGESLFADSGFTGRVVNVDLLTYAGNAESLEDVDRTYGSGVGDVAKRRYFFEKADICDRAAMERIMKQYDVDTIVHFAAESHVDRSILGPDAFVRTNIIGTYTLLDVARKYWNCSLDNPRKDVLFHHISTDEVYGSLGADGYFTETTSYDPRSPYSASKASSDHLVMAYYHTYGLPVTLSNCSNNYGPYQFPEKLIPLMVLNMTEKKPLPVYGEGKNIRDWIYVEDHNRAVWQIINRGICGQKYNIGGENEQRNVDLLEKLIEITAVELHTDPETFRNTITHVKDRAGHDQRYAIDCSKIKKELGWQRQMDFAAGLRLTVRWYLSHTDWIAHIQSGEYQNWIEKNYKKR